MEMLIWIRKIRFYNRAHSAVEGARAYHMACHEPFNDHFIYN